MKYILVMKFWTDGKENSDRIRNLKYTLPRMFELSNYLKLNGVDNEAKIYDFSPTKIVPTAIHIPYPLSEYRKGEKTNLILRENKQFDYIFMFDCDTFFSEKDFHKVLEITKSLQKRKIVTFDLAKLEESTMDKIEKGVNFELHDEKWWFAYSGPKENGPLFHTGGGLGGVYICDMELLNENGGFNEEIVGWGSEDGDMLSRIFNSNKPFEILPQRLFAPFHLPHFTDWGNEKYSKRYLHERTKI
jgi:hypothetical protein